MQIAYSEINLLSSNIMLIKHSKIRWMMTDPNAMRLFRYLFAGSRDGVNSIAIIKLLIQQPSIQHQSTS
jgi:hypothetical protein